MDNGNNTQQTVDTASQPLNPVIPGTQPLDPATLGAQPLPTAPGPQYAYGNYAKKKLSGGKIALIVVACVLGVALLVGSAIVGMTLAPINGTYYNEYDEEQGAVAQLLDGSISNFDVEAVRVMSPVYRKSFLDYAKKNYAEIMIKYNINSNPGINDDRAYSNFYFALLERIGQDKYITDYQMKSTKYAVLSDEYEKLFNEYTATGYPTKGITEFAKVDCTAEIEIYDSDEQVASTDYYDAYNYDEDYGSDLEYTESTEEYSFICVKSDDKWYVMKQLDR